MIQNFFTLKLQRHSDHHANSYKPYQCLLSLKESPELAGGYAGIIFMVLVPPVWFAMTNHAAVEVNNGLVPSIQGKAKSKKVYYLWFVFQVTIITALLPFGKFRN